MAQPNIRHLDNYVGCFYEDNVEKQIQATKNVLVLLLDFKNIQTILEHESLLQLLSRMLQEEHKKSIELCVYLQCVFYVLANYAPFHQYLTQFQVGKATMDIIEYQIDRFDIRYSEYIELWKTGGGQRTTETDKELRKLNYLISKQDKLFFLCISILMNLSEDPLIEKKMKKNGIIKTLIRMLERNDFHLLVVTLLFLKKLSIVAENKDEMIQQSLIQKLSRFFSCENEVLLDLALGLYRNLCFDDAAKERISSNNLLPKFIELLHGSSRFQAINILYLLSIYEPIRNTLGFTDLMQLTVQLINHFPQKIVGQQLIALAINMSCNKTSVNYITQIDLHGLVDRALRNEDNQLLKFCKNVWKNTESAELVSVGKGFMKEFLKITMSKSKNEQLLIEVVGILASLNLGVAWKQFLSDGFINFIDKQLTNGIAEDDIVLETVMVISNICQSQAAAERLAQSQIFKSLMGLFIDKMEDPEFTTQILYAIYMFLYHKLCTADILDEGEVLMRMILLVDTPYEPLRKMNDQVLNILREFDNIDVIEGIKERKFLEYNKEWLKSTEEYGQSQMDQYAMFDAYVDNDELDPRMWESEDDYD